MILEDVKISNTISHRSIVIFAETASDEPTIISR